MNCFDIPGIILALLLVLTAIAFVGRGFWLTSPWMFGG
ncbi:hypothetical protein FHT76_003494 [Rhizobium sp. BK176]|nr:hypothetical protein [Rhizobium sp. BK176]